MQPLEAIGDDADNEAEQAERHGREQQEGNHPERMRDAQRDEQTGRKQDDQPQDDRLGRGRADIAEHDLQVRDGRGENLVNSSGEARKVDPERCVHDALGEQGQHDQSGNDERAVAHALDLGDARADGSPEHHEIKRGRDHRRHDALQQRAPGSRHLKAIDRAHRVDVHGHHGFTRSTKMSSSELCLVSRSRNLMPASRRSASRAVMPVRSSCVS